MRSYQLVSIFFIALLVSGCSAKFNVTHVDKGNLAAALNKPGVFYTLPKTELDVMVPMRVETKSGDLWQLTDPDTGNITSDLKKIGTYCTSRHANENNLSQTSQTQNIYLGQATLSTKGVPDVDQIYFLKADFAAFAKFSHTINLNSVGVIKSAESNVTNSSVAATQFGLSLIEQITSFSLAPDQQQTKKCKQILALLKDIKPLEEAYQQASDAKTGYLKKFLRMPDPIKKTSSGLHADALKILDANISATKTSLQSSPHYRAAYGGSSNYYFTISQNHLPDTNSAAGAQLATLVAVHALPVVKPEIDTTKAGLATVRIHEVSNQMTDSDLADPSKVAGYIKTNGLIELSLQRKGMAELAGGSIDKDKKGYRYRIPGFADAIVKVAGIESLVQEVPVAQFGHLALLPAKIGGLSANIEPTFDADTGGLTKLVLGATALDTKAALEAIESFKGLVEKEAEASELDLLTEENSLLEARKTNAALKADLGIK
ncbi:MAG: hypothetical protein ACJAYF_001439 [Arenicella sp.]|jgi:hypothetical protein